MCMSPLESNVRCRMRSGLPLSEHHVGPIVCRRAGQAMQSGLPLSRASVGTRATGQEG